MALETPTYLSGLVTTNPTATDPKSQGDDHLRMIKSVLLNSFAGFPGMVIVTGTEAQGGTANDYGLTISPSPVAYTASMLVVFNATHANTGAVTIQVNALGTKSLLSVDGTALLSGDIESGSLIAAYYYGTSFFLISANDRANRNGETYSGTHDFTGATLTAETLPYGSSGDDVATVDYVSNAAFNAVLPSQTGNTGKALFTDGVIASWDWAVNHQFNMASGIV